jgi:uncharacterized membrane protein HdeD (DUF308 family)
MSHSVALRSLDRVDRGTLIADGHVGRWFWRRRAVIVLGLILLILGFVLNISILWTLGVILLVIGVVLFIAGRMGHAIGGRKHYF